MPTFDTQPNRFTSNADAPEDQPDFPEYGRKLLLKNIPVSFSEEELMYLFRAFHPLTCEKPQYAPKIAFMVFRTSEEANEALSALDQILFPETGKRLKIVISTSNKGGKGTSPLTYVPQASEGLSRQQEETKNGDCQAADALASWTGKRESETLQGQDIMRPTSFNDAPLVKSPRIPAVRGEEVQNVRNARLNVIDSTTHGYPHPVTRYEGSTSSETSLPSYLCFQTSSIYKKSCMSQGTQVQNHAPGQSETLGHNSIEQSHATCQPHQPHDDNVKKPHVSKHGIIFTSQNLRNIFVSRNDMRQFLIQVETLMSKRID